MDSKNEMTRKQFLVLTFSLVGTTAAMGSSCSDDDNNNVTGAAGSSGTGRGGTTGAGGAAGTTGTGGSAGTTGGGGATGTAACADPLPETQAASDHTQKARLEPAQLTTLKGGGTVTVTSSTASAHTHVFTISCH